METVQYRIKDYMVTDCVYTAGYAAADNESLYAGNTAKCQWN